MKYCIKCGKEISERDIYCPHCGARQVSLEETEEAIYGPNPNQGLRTAAYVFMLIATILTGFLLIPLFWTIPMTVHYYHSIDRDEQVSTAFKVCSLLFVSIIGGILMLCDTSSRD